MRTSPKNITTLKPNEIFVFGSNESGIHGGGAARYAKEHFGAVYGKGFGIQRQSLAIPTKDWEIKELDLRVISVYVSRAIALMKMNPNLNFLVTEIGCGLAGYTPQQIAPMFSEALNIQNIFLPESFINILKK